jgi:hypothetical protein
MWGLGDYGPTALTISPQLTSKMEHAMVGKRSFSPVNIPTKAKENHGQACYTHTSPDAESKDVKSLDVYLTFEEALKLSMALQSCMMSLNQHNRSFATRRDMGLLLSVRTETKSIAVIETSQERIAQSFIHAPG